jgi:hypothetical protein
MTTELKQIFIKTLGGKTIVLDVSYTDTIANVKQKIYNKVGPAELPPNKEFLGLRRRNTWVVMKNHLTLADYNIQRDFELQLIYRNPHNYTDIGGDTGCYRCNSCVSGNSRPFMNK